MVFASEAVDESDTDMDSFKTIYGNGDGLLTEFPFPVVDFSGSLANIGEALILYGPDGMVVDHYNYTSFIGSGADGGGFSIERLDSGGPSVDSNFRVSEISGGTPGMWNSVSEPLQFGDANPVPEPATYMLLMTGLFLVAWRGGLLRAVIQTVDYRHQTLDLKDTPRANFLHRSLLQNSSFPPTFNPKSKVF